MEKQQILALMRVQQRLVERATSRKRSPKSGRMEAPVDQEVN